MISSSDLDTEPDPRRRQLLADLAEQEQAIARAQEAWRAAWSALVRYDAEVRLGAQ